MSSATETTGPPAGLPVQPAAGPEPAAPAAHGPAARPEPAPHPAPDTATGRMVVCGRDALTHRLALELATLHGREVTVVLPSLQEGHGPQLTALAAELPAVRVLEATDLTPEVLTAAGVRDAAALALTGADDQVNIQAALRARRLNPGLRLVLRVYDRRLGRRVAQLLDRTAATRHPGASATVLSTSATAAPALVAAAVSGQSQVVNVAGRLLRATEADAARAGGPAGTAVATLALIPPGARRDAADLLPDPGAPAADRARRVVLELLVGSPESRRRRLPGLTGLPVATLFAPRLRWALASFAGVLAAVAALTSALTGGNPLHTGYLAVLDALAIADPATDGPAVRKVLQILTAVAGVLLMPVLTALALEAMGTFRAASALRRPPRGIAGHVVLVGLGRVGSRVLDRLWELGVPVVCVESDPGARGVARARAYGVPVLLGDATQDGVLEAARIGRARALLALTSSDGGNLEAALCAREADPGLRVVLGLFDDEFAGDVYRALRDSYPGAETRSHSVSFLSAPAFAAAMMGRQVLGAFTVGQQVVLIAAVDAAGHPELLGRTVAEAHRAGHWRLLALERGRSRAAAGPGPGLDWAPPAGHRLTEEDLVVVAATAAGLARLLAGGPVG
ncbi:NAD-binding protein [Kitasatospora camelliae]|uniref:NAD-binding protein n=1 Tax=Kitasatospora camelliae TaxID=3156397 RepID=A0AAU8K0L6_9ACTN